MPSVVRINVTPVKSMALTHPEEVALSSVGVAENRLFYLVDDQGRGSAATDSVRCRPSGPATTSPTNG